MNKQSIEKILKLLDIIQNETNFTEEELNNKEDDSIRWLFYDIKTECNKVLYKEEVLKERVNNYVINFLDGGI